jgi:LmbE family N-acetylglucosaminyl deacetylase
VTTYHRVLVVAAHPDDEALGCGGWMKRLSLLGARVSVVFLADGVGSRGPERDVDPVALAQRESAAREAAGMLGASVHAFHRLPDNRLDTVALLDVAQRIEEAKRDLEPDLVLTHHPGDLNVDHRVVSLATVTAFRPKPAERWCEILAFEIPTASDWGASFTGTPFVPDTFVEITATLETKLAAYGSYGDEVPPDPHARSTNAVRHLAELRGRQAGVPAAEAFVTLRRLLRQ